MPVFRVFSTKDMGFRGQREKWGNGYHFLGAIPADAAAWDALFAAVWAAEKPCLNSDVRLVRMQGWDTPATVKGQPQTTQTRGLDYTPTATGNQGTLSAAGGSVMPSGNEAVVVRFRAGQTARGKPAYVMKYLHGVYRTGADDIPASTVTTINANMNKLRDGTLPAGVVLCRPNGVPCGAADTKLYVTTRTLKRRGKRPTTP